MKKKMQNRTFYRVCIFSLILPLYPGFLLTAQDRITVDLEDAVNLALQNNHLLNVKKYQVSEKQQKVNEDKIKYLPTIAIGGSYQYNNNLPSLSIYQGQFGKLPYGGIYIPLPATDEIIQMGNHNIYNAGVTFYQPLTQIGKISAGVQVSKTDLQIARTEESKAAFQIRQSVEKLYFGLLILRKQIEEAEIRVNLARIKLADIETALSAGKTTESGRSGMAAAAAEEEQTLLKLKIQYDDLEADLRQIAGLSPSGELVVRDVSGDTEVTGIVNIDTALSAASAGNNDLKIASFYNSKADYSLKASKLSYLPDLGLLGGYTYQEGSVIYPRNNTFIGASLKWNLQDMIANHSIMRQRIFLKKQAEENLANTKEQISKDILKACRKIRQSEELMKVAKKAVEYRGEDLKIQADKRKAGLNLEPDLLSAKAAMAKSEADYLAARLNYRIALSDLKILTGAY